jgi:hypothetical protein
MPHSTTVITGPLPWEEDYPDQMGASTATTNMTPTRSTTSSPDLQWDDDAKPPHPSRGTSKPVPHVPGTTTTTISSATFVYFPAPTEAPLLSANISASLMANLPCNEGNILERFQCLGQYLLSIG